MDTFLPEDRRMLRLTVAMVGAALWGGLMLSYYVFVHRPLVAHEETCLLRIEELKVWLGNSRDVVEIHRDLVDQVQELKEEIRTVRRRIPAEPREANFLNLAATIAAEEGMMIRDFQRGEIHERNKYSEVEVILRGQGSYYSICRFLNRVTQLERLSTVRYFAIGQSGSDNSYPIEVRYALKFGMKADPLSTSSQGNAS